MKTKLSIFVLFLALSPVPCALSQTPQGFNYQAVARDASENTIVNTPLPVRITIQTDSVGGTILWQELHPDVVTTSLGVINLVVGKGARQAASTLESFSEIDWSVAPKFLKTEIDYEGWETMGVTRFWAVPYSLVADELAGSVRKLTVLGETADMEEPLFEVKNRNGQTVFAVYNEGVRVYVSDGDTKGLKGGFAVGGFGTDKAASTKYMFVGKDSVRIYMDTNPSTKGLKGGFAVGGYDLTKGTIQNYLEINDENTTVYVNDNPGKGLKGGFAVGGFDATKAETAAFMNITRQNYLIGHEAGKSITTGTRNMFLGYQAGILNSTGYRNIFIGELSGSANTVGYDNVFLGYNAGMSNTGTTYSDQGSKNVYIGVNSGKLSTLGVGNTFVGANSGTSMISGVRNTFIGNAAGASTNASDNTFLGYNAGTGNSTGESNTCVGYSAGGGLTSGSYNTVIGHNAGSGMLYASYNILIGLQSGRILRGQNNTVVGNYAGYSMSNSSGNVLIGNRAGYSETGNDKLYIENSNSTTPLIGGNFATNRVGINRMPTTYTLEVGGTIWANGSSISAGATTWSDARYKTDIRPFENALSTLLQLRGVTYNWKYDEFPGLVFSDGEQIGLIAQEVEKILPQLVTTSPDGYKSLSYEKLSVVLLEGMKEQQKQIEELKALVMTLMNK